MDAATEPFPLFEDADEEAEWFDGYLAFIEQAQPTELPVKTYERTDTN